MRINPKKRNIRTQTKKNKKTKKGLRNTKNKLYRKKSIKKSKKKLTTKKKGGVFLYPVDVPKQLCLINDGKYNAPCSQIPDTKSDKLCYDCAECISLKEYYEYDKDSIYHFKPNKSMQHLYWNIDRNDMDNKILGLWILTCGVHSLLLVCYISQDIIPNEKYWISNWKDLKFFTIEYESMAGLDPLEGIINTNNLTKNFVNEITILNSKQIQNINKFLMSLINDDSTLKISDVGCIVSFTKKWTVVDYIPVNKKVNVKNVYDITKLFLHSHKIYSLLCSEETKDKAHCQTYTSCIWEIFTGTKPNTQLYRP